MLCGLVVALLPAFAHAQTDQRERTANRPVRPDPATDFQHPLAPLLKLAHQRLAHVRENVKDFSCRLVKRERIDGELQDYRYIDLCVREEVRSPGEHGKEEVVKPLGVYMEFLAPAAVGGRKILFVAGEHENKMLVRKGGQRLSYLVLRVDPDGATARSETMLPIATSSFPELLTSMVAVLDRQIEADPQGANTRVQQTAKARLNDRPCTVFRITHPQRQPELGFYLADIYLDADWQLPVRVETYGWPSQPEEAPPLLAEFNYVNLRFNQYPSDAQFVRRALEKQAGNRIE